MRNIICFIIEAKYGREEELVVLMGAFVVLNKLSKRTRLSILIFMHDDLIEYTGKMADDYLGR